MIVGVESNFILEIALGQKESDDAEGILELAESGDIALVIPSFSLGEPLSTVTQRARRRKAVHRSVVVEVRDLGRSTPHRQIVASLAAVVDDLLTAERVELDRLEQTLARVLRCARVVALGDQVFSLARAYRARFSISLQDSIVLATIIAGLRTGTSSAPACFISKNWSDFDEVRVAAELDRHDITYLSNFKRGLEFCQPRGSTAS